MSQTWVIKDTAPVDAASRELSAQQCSFTSNEQEFSSISIADDGAVAVYVLRYDDFEVTAAEVGFGSYEFDWSGNEAYRTLVFDTAPTGELLAWLQKNADCIVSEEVHRYQDMHLSDVDLNTQFKQYMSAGQYNAALAILQNDKLTDKTVVAALFNYVTGRLVAVQSTSDPTFKQDVIKVATQPPADMTSGQVYFKLKE